MTRSFAALALVAALAGPVRADSPPEIHYAPEERLDRLDAVPIATAKTSIDLASYALTDRFVIDAALTAAKNRHVPDTDRFSPSEPRNKIVLTQTPGQTPSFQMAGSIDEAIVARATHKRRGDIHRVQPEPFAAGSNDNAFVIAIPVTNDIALSEEPLIVVVVAQ